MLSKFSLKWPPRHRRQGYLRISRILIDDPSNQIIINRGSMSRTSFLVCLVHTISRGLPFWIQEIFCNVCNPFCVLNQLGGNVLSGVWTNIILTFFYTTPLHFESEGVLWAEFNTPPTKSLYLLVFHYINYSSCSSIVWEEGALQWITSIHLGILHHSCQFSKKNFLEHKLWDISNFGNNTVKFWTCFFEICMNGAQH